MVLRADSDSSWNRGLYYTIGHIYVCCTYLGNNDWAQTWLKIIRLPLHLNENNEQNVVCLACEMHEICSWCELNYRKKNAALYPCLKDKSQYLNQMWGYVNWHNQ